MIGTSLDLDQGGKRQAGNGVSQWVKIHVDRVNLYGKIFLRKRISAWFSIFKEEMCIFMDFSQLSVFTFNC